jgi:hypothetical protein
MNRVGRELLTSCISATTMPSGSCSEFYIEPMLSCIDDTDIMWHFNNHVAIPAGLPLPKNLPPEFDNEVTVCELTKDSCFSCYVFARSVCKPVRHPDSGNYSRVSCPTGFMAVPASSFSSTSCHGPADATEHVNRGIRHFRANKPNSTFYMIVGRCYLTTLYILAAAGRRMANETKNLQLALHINH